MSKEKSSSGFTLIELLVVVIILSILAAIGLPSLLGGMGSYSRNRAMHNAQEYVDEMNAENTAYSYRVLGCNMDTTGDQYASCSILKRDKQTLQTEEVVRDCASNWNGTGCFPPRYRSILEPGVNTYNDRPYGF